MMFDRSAGPDGFSGDHAAGTTSVPHGLTGARGWLDGREVLMLSYPHEPSLPLERLTTAEREITVAVLAGRKNAEIARSRGTSPRTIAKQVAAAMAKLGVRGRGELAAAASGVAGGHVS
jgi:DNA-binding NarL/FixJ family response regulator